jgi:hypothetical protein
MLVQRREWEAGMDHAANSKAIRASVSSPRYHYVFYSRIILVLVGRA